MSSFASFAPTKPARRAVREVAEGLPVTISVDVMTGVYYSGPWSASSRRAELQIELQAIVTLGREPQPVEPVANALH